MTPVPIGSSDQNPPGRSLLQLLREDWVTHDCTLWEPGLWLLAAHRFGNWRMGFRWKLARAPLTLAYRVLYFFVEMATGASLTYTVRVGRRVRIWHRGGMVFGAQSIGDDVHLRQNTTFGVARRGDPADAKPVIGDRVDVGAGACILGPVTVGHDAVIGANAVVLADVPPWGLAVGVPARIKARRPVPTPSADGVPS